MYEILELNPCSPLFSLALWAGAPSPALREFSNSNNTDSSALILPAQLALILEQLPYDINTLTKSLSTIVPDIDINWSRIEVEWESPKARIPEPWKLKSDLNAQAN